MFRNLILDTDSYKTSHYRAYPPGTTSMFSYFESRGGRYDATVFFGLQYLLKEHLEGPTITHWCVLEARDFCKAHGVPFNTLGWHRIVDLGYLPVRIRAVPEGTVVPVHTPLFTVESTDPETFWIVSWLETMLVRLWYPITVATQSYNIRKTILRYLEKTSDPGAIDFKLHDFGGRGVTCREQAGIGGMAHLTSFKGSDTIQGVRFANQYYNSPMSGFSIPAAEHSTVTMWGKNGEEAAYRHMIKEFGKPGALVACVSDSYDYWHALDLWTGPLLDEVKASGATLVIRPDSGDPADVVLKTLQHLEMAVGCEKNSKGYKVLPPYFRVIQGDGVNEDSIEDVLHTIKCEGYSADNVTFGMGGALLQQMNRDTQKAAFKCSSAIVDGVEIDVFKSPVDDPGKASKAGRLDHPGLRTVFENGKILIDDDFETVRGRLL